MTIYVVTILNQDLVEEVRCFKTREAAEEYASLIESSYARYTQIWEDLV